MIVRSLPHRHTYKESIVHRLNKHLLAATAEMMEVTVETAEMVTVPANLQ